ncbi:hypothetical protein GE21DRAFT_6088 [Neurospora crassa]|uniref:C2H2-type domain-containing protein n=1 Tax=Neurospora crassa (strain ATCC 24698 / 74-OR23-1A / CBS 708.71 / DSM 1257 / FGSC 987) TaxID=367110 RepID=Q7RZ51_NEUCR|nr:hypothetical protein NCU04423 [Neurospora crassa OR74A]EAA28264.2 hypothetical protein NCU04423 [Neurospora crassa OR74A]KHE88576.1 hypothetical protein GE21DRAFT_6088 [Neurospora crassa]|eukprot:XP_957500.2 hypothetical protein NCU04423 [Neurospora crassa OR74A]
MTTSPASDVPHWRLQEQLPESAAPLSPHHEPQAPPTRPTAPAAPDTPPQPDAPRIPLPSSTAAAPTTGSSTSATAIEPPTSNAAPSPTAKADHQHLPSCTGPTTATATPRSSVSNSNISASSVTANIPQDPKNGTVPGGVDTAAPGGSFHSSEQPTTVTTGAARGVTVDGPPSALNGQPQQSQNPSQVPAPSPIPAPDATNSAATSTSTSTPANATVSATDPATTTIPSTTITASARSNFRDPIRWRDPITVHYDSDSGHAHPARLHAQSAHPASASSSSSSQLPPPSQLKYELFRQHIEHHPPSQPATESQLPAQAQLQSLGQPAPAQARSHHEPNRCPPSRSHPQTYHTQQPPLQPAPVPVTAIQPPPPAHSPRQSYQHHLQASPYQYQAPPPAHPQHHYQHSYPVGAPQHHPPPPPSQQQHHPYEYQYPSRNDGLISRPIIMDPPRSRPVSQLPPPAEPISSSGFPSPATTHAHLNKKFADDCTRLTYAIQQSTPEAVRRVVRDNWEKCMLGTEFHQAFILNAAIHHAVPSITRRAVRDFGQKMVLESKHELISHFSTADLDDIADAIINKASEAFLDKCLNARLLTIEAKPLITALAKAERLGYNPADIVEEQHERVTPTSQAARPPPPPQSTYPGRLQCMGCYRVFTHQVPYEYHTSRRLCTVRPPASAKGFEFSCQYCGEGFTRSDEHQTHERARTCFHPGPPLARGPGRPPRAAPVPSSIVQATPAVARTIDLTSAGSTPSAETPAGTKTPNAADPYGHLTEEQLAAMDADLKEAEAKFAPRFAEAYAIPDENERRIKIEGLRNSFGTKQSMIRKKYGVRLRQRRTKAEIQAEEERMGLEKLRKKQKAAAQQAAAAAASASVSAATGTALPRPAGSGWVAANAPRANAVWEEHEAKRRRMDASGTYQTPTKSTLSVSEIGGGLAGVAATAETHDPTRPSPISGHQTASSNGQSEDEEDSASGSGRSSTANDEMDVDEQPGSGPASRPLQNNHNSNHNDDDDDDDDSDSSDDEDIPSTLPAHVRQTLATRNA